MNLRSLTQINQWVNQKSLKALEEAYKGALIIKDIEDKHFGGNAIKIQPNMGKTVTDYFRTQLNRQMIRIRSSLVRFQISSFLVNRQTLDQSNIIRDKVKTDDISEQNQVFETSIVDKLAFIESVVSKYRGLEDLWDGLSESESLDGMKTVPVEILQQNQQNDLEQSNTSLTKQKEELKALKVSSAKIKPVKSNDPQTIKLFGGVEKIGKEFNPKYEEEVIRDLRMRRTQNRKAVRWLAILLFIPLLVQVVTKNVIFDPILGDYFELHPTQVELSNEIEEEFLHKFSEYKEALEVKHLLAKAVVEQQERKHEESKNTAEEEEELAIALFGDFPSALLKDTLDNQPGKFRSLLLTDGWTEVEEELQEKALEEKALDLWREARNEQLNGIKNVLADFSGLFVFIGLVYFGKDKIAAVRNFSNRAFLSLNDPTKVFMFILVSDMFVGFHSAEGWEVILESIAHHFGLPESKVFINSFIATVPVFLDSCIKFWIFTYLTRYSASASAIYERMNT